MLIRWIYLMLLHNIYTISCKNVLNFMLKSSLSRLMWNISLLLAAYDDCHITRLWACSPISMNTYLILVLYHFIYMVFSRVILSCILSSYGMESPPMCKISHNPILEFSFLFFGNLHLYFSRVFLVRKMSC